MNITSRQLKAFLLTARHQSFSRAAEQLFITQSGMSVLIRELEDQLGFRLFDRTTRRVKLTEFGTRFLPIADRSVLELESAAANIGRSASVASRTLTIGAMPFIATKLLAGAIGEFAKRDPGLNIVMHDSDRTRLVAMVASGEVDVALGCFIEPVPGLRRIPLHRFALMAICAGTETRANGVMRWEELVQARLLGMPADVPLQQLVNRHLQRLGRRGPPDLVFNYFETLIAMAEAGAGVAVVPTFAIPACLDHKLAMHPLVDPALSVDLYELVDRGRKLPPGAEEFSEFLKGYIAHWAEACSPTLAHAA